MFDGLQNVLERCLAWYEDRLNAEKIGELARDDLKGSNEHDSASGSASNHDREGEGLIPGEHQISLIALPTGVQIYVADPITDRKSVFVGRACRISHPSEVSDCVQLVDTHSFFILGYPYFIPFNVR